MGHSAYVLLHTATTTTESGNIRSWKGPTGIIESKPRLHKGPPKHNGPVRPLPSPSRAGPDTSQGTVGPSAGSDSSCHHQPEHPDPFLQGRSPAPHPVHAARAAPSQLQNSHSLFFMQVATALKFGQISLQGLSTLRGPNTPPSLASSTNSLHTTSLDLY